MFTVESNGQSRAPGVRDVARVAGVSRQTVSRVMNEHPSIRDETRMRVLAAMEELRFRPNRAARMLTTARSMTIGVLASSASTLFGPASSIDAVEKAARDAGYFVTVAHVADTTAEEVDAALEHLAAQAVDGIVVVAPERPVVDALRSAAPGVPFVTLHGSQEPGEDGVVVDQFAGARLAVRHLLDLGHRRIAHLAGPAEWEEAAARQRGFTAELAVDGLEGIVTEPGDWTSASGARIGAALFDGSGGDGVTAVFSSNDQMALGLLHVLRESGRRVPEDVSVIGFDDIPEAAYFAPPLTTVRQDFRELGRRCVARLLGEIAASAAPPLAAPIAPTLVLRASTGSPR
ncbi:LacI family DNA-binding transcriptional regulator [Leifsonia sp. PS1209]|uniref:LacI family DNA-binding transcriptional regulator n=1 Tax=Leifsonia sp. PS1209 TaxID=2724914 RepID=UPI001442BE39|nr:LacI family DNA-binding transcriptional regulator [Leifsonia sp. PS1209]QIZ99475.1 LacI family transcriptional regulator [Leifsonia sp. PS1209]